MFHIVSLPNSINSTSDFLSQMTLTAWRTE